MAAVGALRVASLLVLGACAVGDGPAPSGSVHASGSTHAGTGGGARDATTTSASTGGGSDPVGGGGTSAASTSSDSSGVRGDGGAAPKPVCAVTEGFLDARARCEPTPQPWGADAPLVEKWRIRPNLGLLSEPLVANLTDDNSDGRIDLCDTPDVLVRYAVPADAWEYSFAVFSGADGALLADVGHLNQLSHVRPAIADLDADGVPEILAAMRSGHVVALRPDGDIVWEGTAEVFDPGFYEEGATEGNQAGANYVAASAIAVHDLEGDGSPEILVGLSVLDARGNLRFQDPTHGSDIPPAFGMVAVRPTAADLDGDGILEVLFGHVTYSAWGEELWRLPIIPGYAHPADFDGDGVPEVLVASEEGLTLVAPDGSILWGPLRPPDEAEPPRSWCWVHPVAVADMDGDGVPEALVNTCDRTMVMQIGIDGPSVIRSQPIPIPTAVGAPQLGSTAFDFRGDRPDWVEYHPGGLRVFEGLGPAWTTRIDHEMGDNRAVPIVADIDNDGSADVVVIEADAEWIVAYEDPQRRPSPARRIWNQWNYWVNHVREDATIPAEVTMPWDSHGTFRVQSRVACEPVDGIR